MIFQQNYDQDLPYIPYNSANKDYARFNRKNPTRAESLMWNLVLKWNETWVEDENRENWMKSKGIKTIRFTNDDVEKNLDWVVQYLEDIIINRRKELWL